MTTRLYSEIFVCYGFLMEFIYILKYIQIENIKNVKVSIKENKGLVLIQLKGEENILLIYSVIRTVRFI